MNIFGIFLSSTDLWLLAIVGVCLAWLVPHRFALWRDHHNRRVTANATFRTAIDPAVFSSFNGRVILSGHMLHAALLQIYPAHLAAAQEFRRYLSPFDRWRFSRAWKAYHGGNEESPDWFVRYCLPTNGTPLLMQRLEALRDVADHT